MAEEKENEDSGTQVYDPDEIKSLIESGAADTEEEAKVLLDSRDEEDEDIEGEDIDEEDEGEDEDEGE